MATISFSSTARGIPTAPALEGVVQKACWSWLATIPLKSHPGKTLQDFTYMVPNGVQLGGGHRGRAAYTASLKSQGFRTGVSDLVVAYPVGPYHGMYNELKRDVAAYKGPKALRTALRPEQREWLELMNSIGYWGCVSYGVDDFKRQVTSYLKKKSPRSLDLFDWLEDTEPAQ